MPFTALDLMGICFRRGQVALLAAAPGGGKTAFTTNFLVAPAIAQSTATLYFSPDSDIMTVGPRILATMQEREVRNIYRDFAAQDKEYAAHLEKAKQLKHIQWCFDTSPAFGDIELELDAYLAVHGHDPDLIILDNIRDIWFDSEAVEYKQHSDTISYFKDIAQRTGAAVLLLHHLTGEYEDSDKPASLKGLQGKVGKDVRLVINLFSPDEGVLGWVIAKNSNGKKHLPGDYGVMDWDLEKQIIS